METKDVISLTNHSETETLDQKFQTEVKGDPTAERQCQTKGRSKEINCHA